MPMLTTPNLFTAAELTDAINKLPVKPLRFRPYFKQTSVRTTSVPLDLNQKHIVLVADQPRGTTPDAIAGRGTTRTAKVFGTAHLPQKDLVRPEDIQDVRAFGTAEPITAETVINDKLQTLKDNIEMTREYHRLGAVKGVVLDADGSTTLLDLFSAFGATKQTQAVTIPVADDVQENPVLAAITAAKRKLEAGMGGNPYQRLECVLGSDAYDMLTGNKWVREFYERWAAYKDTSFGNNDMRRGFTYGGVTFFEASEVVGGLTLVAAAKGHLFPVGPGVFEQFNAPADWMSTANTYGLEYYGRMDPIEADRGYTLEAQSNPLTICTFPEALVELTFSKAAAQAGS